MVSGAWGRDAPVSTHLNFPAKKVPRHFTSLKSWSKTLSVLSDNGISHPTVATILLLAKRGQPFLLDKEKMIAQWIFPRLSTRRHHRKFPPYLLLILLPFLLVCVGNALFFFVVSDIDVVCDV